MPVVIVTLMLLFASCHSNVYDCMFVGGILLFERDTHFLTVVPIGVMYHIVAWTVGSVGSLVVFEHKVPHRNHRSRVHEYVYADE